MIPKFPKFKTLTLADKPTVEKITRKFPPYSDYNFASMWNYNTHEDVEISKLNSNLVVNFRDYITNERFYSFIGKSKPTNTSDQLLNIQAPLQLIPLESANNRSLRKKYIVKADKNNYDYILSLEEYRGLKGKKFSTKRHNIAHFLNKFPNHKASTIKLSDPTIKKEIIKTFKSWSKIKPKEESEHELIALTRFLRYINHFDTLGVGIWHMNQMIGFSIVDLDHGGYAHNHFMKTLQNNKDNKYRGLHEFLDHLLAEHLMEKGFKYLNIQQDLGISTLRKAKKASRPVKMLKKYTISPRSWSK